MRGARWSGEKDSGQVMKRTHTVIKCCKTDQLMKHTECCTLEVSIWEIPVAPRGEAEEEEVEW